MRFLLALLFLHFFSLSIRAQVIPKLNTHTEKKRINIEQLNIPNLPVAHSSEQFQLNAHLLQANFLKIGDFVDFNLFNNGLQRAKVTYKTTDVNGVHSVILKFEEAEISSAFLAFGSEEYLLSIDLLHQNKRYQTVYDRVSQNYYMVELDNQVYGHVSCGDSPTGDCCENHDEHHESVFPEILVNTPGIQLDNCHTLTENDNADIDILVVYTPSSLNWAGGLAGMNNIIALALARCNDVSINSDLSVSYNLAYSGLTDYNEENFASSTHLFRLQNPNDGFMDEVHQLRNTYNADFVHLFSTTWDVGGIAFLNTNRYGSEDYAFGLTVTQQAASTYTMIHEVSHNMGISHAAGQLTQPGPTPWSNWPENQWSAGNRFLGDNNVWYCDVMTYNTSQYWADGITSITIPFLTAPELAHQGTPIGVPNVADARQTIRKLKHMYSKYRDETTMGYCGAWSTSQSALNIAGVQLNNLSNNSGWFGYRDYSYMTTSLSKGESYPFAINTTGTNSNARLKIWIDWNDDHEFDEATELVYESPIGAVANYNFNLTIPQTASTGQLRMRLKYYNANSNTNHTACGQISAGEIEDYSIFVKHIPEFNFPSFVCTGDPIFELPEESTNGITGTWSPQFNNLATGSYFFTTDFPNCSESVSKSIIINPDPAPVFNITNSICAGDQLALPQTSINGISGTWSPTINNLETTAYTFTPAISNCIKNHSVIVNPILTPEFIPIEPICVGATLNSLPSQALNSISGYWLPAPNNQQTTTYSFVPNPGECSTNSSMTIVVNSIIPAEFELIEESCDGNWINPFPTISDNLISGVWSQQPNYFQTTTYYFTPNPQHCSNVFEHTIIIKPWIEAEFEYQYEYCQGDFIPDFPSVSLNDVQGTWFPPINNQQSTPYQFTPNANECSSSTYATIYIIPYEEPYFYDVDYIDFLCQGAPIFSLPTQSDMGHTGQWQPSVLNSNQTTTYTFTPDQGVCANEKTVTIPVFTTAPNFFSSSVIGPYCAGEVLALPTHSEPAYYGYWWPPLNNSQTATYTYFPDVTSCVNQQTVTIQVAQYQNPTFNIPTTQCQDSQYSLPSTSNNGFSGVWSPIFNNQTNTTYTFTPNSGQCANTINTAIEIIQNLNPTFNIVESICFGDPLAPLPNQSSNNINGTWSPATNNQTTTTYVFTPNPDQCASSTTHEIEVIEVISPSFNIQNWLCLGDSHSDLPSTSLNNIEGAWNPPTINNTQTTNYVFVATSGQCVTPFMLTIQVLPVLTPTFNLPTQLCPGNTTFQLPLVSNNNITGVWNPEFNNQELTTYTFESNQNCTNNYEHTIDILEASISPQGEPFQTFDFAATISNIVLDHYTHIYANFEDALNVVNALPLNQILSNGVYYAVNTAGGCPSEPFAVTVTITLNLDQQALENVVIYPNPVSDVLHVSYHSGIKHVKIYDLAGQLIAKCTSSEVNISQLSAGVYLAVVHAVDGSEFKKSFMKL